MKKLLFFDIETHRVNEYDELNQRRKKAFQDHLWNRSEYPTVEECYREKSALFPEFSHVICVSFGYEARDDEFKVQSIYGMDEIKILNDLSKVFDAFERQGYALCGHFINGFDKPYLIKRYIINGMQVPKMLSKSIGAKPWEIEDVDTVNLWKFGSYSGTSLEVIASSLDIECKSTILSGNNMFTYKIEDIDFNELREYCEEDVISNYRIYKHIKKFI